MWNTVMSRFGVISFAAATCLAVYIQHTEEQYSREQVASRDPTQWMNAMRCGTLPSDGQTMRPPVEPDGLVMRSNWRLVTTFS